MEGGGLVKFSEADRRGVPQHKAPGALHRFRIHGQGVGLGEQRGDGGVCLALLRRGEQISARRMHEDFWSFPPTHKLMLNGNHKPRVSGSDEGIWRRIRLVPWVAVAAEHKDPQLKDKLQAELPAGASQEVTASSGTP